MTRRIAVSLLLAGCMLAGAVACASDPAAPGATGANDGGAEATVDLDATGDAESPDGGGDAAADEAGDGGGVGAVCDLIAQDCAPALKCTVTYRGTNAFATCEVPSGSGGKKAGDPCTAVKRGVDDCEKGNVCTVTFGAPTLADSKFTCLQFCTSEADCGGGAVCALYDRALSAGVCYPTCTMFGGDCRGGTCGRVYGNFVDGGEWAEACRTIGTAKVDDPCLSDVDCAAGEECRKLAGQSTCRAQCDVAHPCGDGGADGGRDAGICYRYPGMPSGRGRCE